jgi:chromosomal replication initiation ATPase DnaA
MSGQLVFPFGIEPALGHEDFILAPCNEQAVRFIGRWPDWPARAAVLHGPAGSGKTHLAAIWRKAAEAGCISARDLVPGALASSAGAWVIEDVDRDEPTPARDRALLELMERPKGVALLTGRAPPSEWPVAIADLKSRFQSLIAFAMWAPDEALLRALVAKHFADRQLEVPQAVITRIVTQVERTPGAIAAFVARADSKALSEKRAITERLILELLAAEDEAPTTD